MAVAVKSTPETTSRQPLDPVGLSSLVGAIYVLGSLALVFYGIPSLWQKLLEQPFLEQPLMLLGPFVVKALLLVLMLAAAIGLVVLGKLLVGTNPPTGYRAGTFCAIFGLLAIVLITDGIGFALERALGAESRMLGMLLTAGTGIVLLGLGAWSLFQPSVKAMILQFDSQGWFTADPYKKTQGMRVRRGTILGVLVLCGCGIYTLLAHKSLEFGSADWALTLPFTEGQRIILLPDVRFSVPILLSLGSLWLAYRVVNYPTFADFLIATEAEMNKVSWTTKKRLVQDTIVVLTTVFLFTVFIFFVDVLWGWSLQTIGVLQFPEAQKSERQQIDW